ncbi:MAG: class I SAM-dependent methyltransferase [Rhodospirillaceae bacterium]
MDFRDAFQDPDYFKLSDEEAAFGFSEIAGIIAGRARPGLRCLEIGSGPGLLLGRLQSHFPDCRFEGLEPVGSGFGKTEAPLAVIAARANLKIHRCGYEDFASAEPYDIIFSVNVFEHVVSWRDYLTRTHGWLAPGGIAVILCPNYAFPWEPHFRLPIVLNKPLTHSFFSARIAAYERNQDYHGLWASLNFVKKREVLRFARTAGLRIDSDDTVMRRMFQRLFTDPAFAGRQRALAGIAKLFYRLGLTRVLEMPGVRLFSPFMALRLMK